MDQNEGARLPLRLRSNVRRAYLSMEYPNILDFEASGFGVESYPIEVGYALSCGERYCTLIKPHPSWRHWDVKAQKIHGINRDQLNDFGENVHDVCMDLNQRLSGRSLYTDGWVCDKFWLNRLFYCAGIEPQFNLHAIENIQTECQYLLWDQTRDQLLQEVELERHRASADAQFVQRLYAQTQTLCTRVAAAH